MKILLLDNYDSFTYNLVHLMEKVSTATVEVVRNDELELKRVRNCDKIILSPGPGLPKDAGVMPELLRQYAGNKPILGVCLGHQAIAEHFGARLINLENVVHGQATPIHILQKESIFKNCPKQFSVGRYHSWVVDKDTLPDALEITAVDENGTIMGMKHKVLAIEGVQFHPESVLSEHGEQMLQRWISE